jgi:hypothetical protein
VTVQGWSIAFDTDIPGDGSLNCLPAACPNANFIGTVVSSPGGLLTGSLVQGGSTLSLLLGANPVFLNFSGADATSTFGPLGLSPAPYFDPNPARSALNNITRDVTRPISGQPITLQVTNSGALPIESLAFFLELTPTVVTSNFTGQNDGLSFGLYCTGTIDSGECISANPQNYSLLITPTGLGSLNAADLNPTTPTFGDLLRFTGVNLLPGQTGSFSFFMSDYKPTRQPGTTGSEASAAFSLEVVPTVGTAAIPEPATMALAGLALLSLAGWSSRKRRRR